MYYLKYKMLHDTWKMLQSKNNGYKIYTHCNKAKTGVTKQMNKYEKAILLVAKCMNNVIKKHYLLQIE